jgi:hypothetical protein
MGALTCGSLDAYAGDIARIRGSHPALAEEIASFVGIGQVMDWFSAKGTPPAIELIGMDEFEYDFLVEVAGESVWLAFGVT